MMLLNNGANSPDRIIHTPPDYIVVIAAGTGGPQALATILPQFYVKFPGTIIVVQQIRHGFTRVLAEQLNHICHLPVHEPTDGQVLQSSRILMTPSGTSLAIESLDISLPFQNMIFVEDLAESLDLQNKRADTIMASAAKAFGRNTIGVLLTGCGSDGVEGLRSIQQAGGVTIVQDESSSVVHDLPAAAIRSGVAQEIMPLWSLADRITELTMGEAHAAAA